MGIRPMRENVVVACCSLVRFQLKPQRPAVDDSPPRDEIGRRRAALNLTKLGAEATRLPKAATLLLPNDRNWLQQHFELQIRRRLPPIEDRLDDIGRQQR